MKFNDLKVTGSLFAEQLHKDLKVHGINFASGVPCGVLRHVIHNLQNDEKILHVLANRESEAVGLAAGAYLAGMKPVLYMQNSGLFASSNDIASLILLCNMPILMLVSLRGAVGETAPQHFVTGRNTIPLLDCFGIPHCFLREGNVHDAVELAFKTMDEQQKPFAILFERGWQNETQ